MLDQFRVEYVKKTSALWTLAQKGLFFSNVITYAPYTFGSIFAIMSGMYGKYNGVNSAYSSKEFKEDKCATMAEYFSKNGFNTYASIPTELTLSRKGFSHYDVYNSEKDDQKREHIEMIKNVDKSKPCFLYLQYEMLHTLSVKDVLKKYDDFSKEMFQNPEKNVKRYESYLPCIEDYLEAIISALKAEGLYDDSLILIFSDHGVSLGEKIGERAYGSFVYQYSINIWFTLLNSGLDNAEINLQVRSIDLLPTILDLFHFDSISYPLKIMGKSLMPMVHNEEKQDRIAFCETAPLGGFTPSPHSPCIKCVIDGTWKYIYNTITTEEELYNVKDDPKEKNNLIYTEPEHYQRLKRLLESELIY